ncbi:MAG: toxin-antitoxin system YwqK family antitoxin [Lewinella sp.]|uniref:toxin-antitoxin system YwqK family antitoxin n=1 Tax=Lewinella sp. TaxID=2004506 RepID=UPI003D6B9A23
MNSQSYTLFLFLTLVLFIPLEAQHYPLGNDEYKEGAYNYYDGVQDATVDCVFKDNKLHGVYRLYYFKSENIKMEGFYSDGIASGVFRHYSFTGKLEKEETFINGQLTGPVKYYRNGRLSFEEFYLNGIPHGVWKFYYKNGNIEAFFSCDNGNCSDILGYDKKGRVVSKVIRGEDGVRVRTIHYKKNGEIDYEELH